MRTYSKLFCLAAIVNVLYLFFHFRHIFQFLCAPGIALSMAAIASHSQTASLRVKLGENLPCHSRGLLASKLASFAFCEVDIFMLKVKIMRAF